MHLWYYFAGIFFKKLTSLLPMPVKSLHLFIIISFCSSDNIFGTMCKQTWCMFKPSWKWTPMWNSKCWGSSINWFSSVHTHDFSNVLNIIICCGKEMALSLKIISNVYATYNRMLVPLVHFFFLTLFLRAFFSISSISEDDFLSKM